MRGVGYERGHRSVTTGMLCLNPVVQGRLARQEARGADDGSDTVLVNTRSREAEGLT